MRSMEVASIDGFESVDVSDGENVKLVGISGGIQLIMLIGLKAASSKEG